MNPIEVLQYVGVPLLVAAFILVCSWLLTPNKQMQPLGAVLAVGVSSLIAFVLQEGFPSIPPSEKWHWLVLTVLIVSLLSCIYPLFRSWDTLIVLQAIIAGFVAAFFMQFPGQTGLLDRVLVLFMVLFVSLGLRRLTIPPWHMYVASWWILAGISILALQSNFAKLAFFAGAMSAVAAILFLLQLINPRETKSVQMIFGVLIVGCSLCGLAYNQTESSHQFAWLLPMIGVPISALAYFIFKNQKYGAIVSLGIIYVFVSTPVIWSIVTTTTGDELWP
jgi:hypothetical protein